MKKTKGKKKYASGGKIQTGMSRKGTDPMGSDRTRGIMEPEDPLGSLIRDLDEDEDPRGSDRTRGYAKGGRVMTRGGGCSTRGNTHKG